jgi:RNA 3'-terminal phosphate cyclase (ATP)
MAALTQQPIKIVQVRGGTAHPGLDIEDLVLLHYLREATAGTTEGAEVGSHELEFWPAQRPGGLTGALRPPVVNGRGANANIVANSLLPVLARSGVYNSLSLTGETYGQSALSFDYFKSVTLEALKKCGLYAFTELVTSGFGREAKGEIALDVEPSSLQGFKFVDRGRLVSCRAVIAHAELPGSIAHRGVAHLQNLSHGLKLPMECEAVGVDSREPGIFLTVSAVFERGFGGATIMGTKGLRIEAMAQQATEDLMDWIRSEATVDTHLADQILIPACVAEGETVFTVNRLTSRFLTSVWVIKQFGPVRITVKGKEGESGVVTIKR